MYYFMILPLLLMGANVIMGHTVRKLEINNKTEADIYEIKEDTAANTISFVNPKADKPTLREIVYYHMIERPYSQQEEGRVRYESEKGPEIDETMRPFTNSHGFPFLETVEKELEIETQNEFKEDIPEEKEETIVEHEPKADEEVVYEDIVYYEDLPVDDKTTKQEEIIEVAPTLASESLKEVPTEPKAEKATDTITEKSSFGVDLIGTNSNPLITEEPVSEDKTQAETVTENQVASSVTETPVFEEKARTARKLLFDRVKEKYNSNLNEKQSLKEVPTEPKAEKATDTITESTPATSERRKRDLSMQIPEAPRLGELNYEGLPPYLRSMISTQNPKARINSDSESDEEERLDDIKHRMHKLISSLKVGDSSEVKPRTYGMNLTADSGYVWNDLTNPGVHFNVEASESIEEEIKNNSEEKPESVHPTPNRKDDDLSVIIQDESFEEELKGDRDPSDGHHGEDEEDIGSIEDDSKNSFEDKGRKRKHKEKDDTMSQLMESEQFWKWLADWTSVYMDVLTDHIKEAVHQEVVDQIKIQEEEHANDSEILDKQKEAEDNLDTAENEEDNEKHNDEMTTPEPINDEATIKPDSDDKDEIVDKNEEDLTRKRKDKDNKKKDEVTNSNMNEESKPHKETAKVEAQNIYGNTIGGDKVTNIFIFYPNQDADKIIKDISKLNASNNIKVDVRLNVTDVDIKDNIQKVDETTLATIEKIKDESIDITTQAPLKKEGDKTTESPIDMEENSRTEAISEDPTTTTHEDTTTEQIDLQKTEPTTESSKAEITTELKKEEDLPNDKIIDRSKEDKSGEKEDDNKTVESEIEEKAEHETETEEQNKEEIVASTIIEEPEASTEPSK